MTLPSKYVEEDMYLPKRKRPLLEEHDSAREVYS